MADDRLDTPQPEASPPSGRDRIVNSNNPRAILTDTAGVIVLGIVTLVLTIALVRLVSRVTEPGSRRRW